MKTIVVPGELVNEKSVKGNGVVISNNKTYSEYVGVLYNEKYLQVVPLNGKYLPKTEDVVIGYIEQLDINGYICNVNSYKSVYLHKNGLSKKLNLGDIVLAKISSVNEIKDFGLEIKGILRDGILMNINAKKVPRVIGKNKSMLELLQKYSKSNIRVGANGYIYVVGGNYLIVKDALEIIEKYSHVDNLTEKLNKYLSNK